MNTCNIHHATSTGLSGTQFSALKSAGFNNPGGPEKYNKNTKVKYGATFYSCHTALELAVVKCKNLETD
jgi:hypothetical protein